MQGRRWYEKSYRRNLVDMHIEDWDETFLSRLDPRTYVRLLKTAAVQSAMVYANSHVGYCYWPTKTGQTHRGIRGRDILGEIIALCHGEGIDVIPYYSLLFNNWAYENHPSWRLLDANGRPSRERSGRAGRYGVCCPNCLEYRHFVQAQIQELCTGYEFEGMFFDMTFWPEVCYCPSCKERFSREAGGEMPTTIDWQNARWLTFQKKREEWLAEFAAFATGTAKKHKPDISVEHNSAVLPQSWRVGAASGLIDQNDYVGGDLYGGFLQQSFICKLYQSITPNKPFEYMTSRCYPSLREHTASKPREMLELHTYLSLAHGGAFLFIDAIDPLGTLDPRIYETMGQIFGRSREYEPHLGGEMLQDVAVYFSLESKMDFADNGKHVAAGSWAVPHLEAALGAARTLKENHIPFGVISRRNLKDASGHKVIILPNALMVDEEEAAAIRRFVTNGGGLYASGRVSPALLGDVFGVSIEGETEETITYMSPTSEGQRLMPGIHPDYPLAISGRQTKARALNEDEVVATLTLPYTDPEDNTRMASIHSNPPGIATDYAAIVHRTYGQGRVIWVSAPLETTPREPHRTVLARLVRALAGAPFSFEAEAPAAVEVLVFDQPDSKRYIVSLVNEQEDLPAIPVSNTVVRIRTDGKRPVRAALLPDEEPLPLVTTGDFAEIRVPELQAFRMFALTYE